MIKGYVDPGIGDLQIDFNNYTVIPRLMDTRIHLSGESNPKKHSVLFAVNLDDYTYRSISYAKKLTFRVSNVLSKFFI